MFEQFFLSCKSIVENPAFFIIDMRTYSHHIASELLGEPSYLPPGAEDHVGLYAILPPEDFFDLLENLDLDLDDIE